MGSQRRASDLFFGQEGGVNQSLGRLVCLSPWGRTGFTRDTTHTPPPKGPRCFPATFRRSITSSHNKGQDREGRFVLGRT